MFSSFARLVFPFVLLSIRAFSQNAQTPKLDKLASDFIAHIGKEDREKVFVQTDKWIYAAGEDIWLRAYCIGSVSHSVMRESKSLFVDLVNDRDSLVDLIILNNGLQKLDGRIGLPAGLTEGYYWLRAYTRRMLKEDSIAVYVQPVYVFNPDRRDRQEMTPQEEGLHGNSVTGVRVDTANAGLPEVRFYPEGGTFIAGSSTKFGFTAFDRQGKPMDLFGYVTDSANAIVAKYGTNLGGLGSFILFADRAMKYTAHTVYGPGKVLATALPAPTAHGYQLSVASQSDDSVYFLVSLGDSVYKKFKSTYVLGISHHKLYYAAVGKDMYAFAIAKESLPAGKTSLLLFNEEQKIVSQRDIYIRKDNPRLSVVADRASYRPRQKVNLNITAGNGREGDGPSILSVAVAEDREAVKSAWTRSLSGIDRNDIVFPYEDLPDSAIDRYSPDQWDLLMLLQPDLYLGWQKSADAGFAGPSWEQSDSDVTKLTGRVLGRRNKPEKNRVVTLLSNYGGGFLETDTINESGKFQFRLPDNVSDSTQLNFQVSDIYGSKIDDSIAMDPPGFPRFNTPVVLKNRFSKLQTSAMEDFNRYQLDTLAAFGKGKGWLKPVIVERAKKTPVTYDESKIVSPFSRIIPGDQIGLNPNSIENALLSTPGVGYRNGRVIIRGGGIQDPISGSTEPIVFVDGSEFDLHLLKMNLLGFLSTLNPRTVDFIEVLEGADANVYGPGSDRGVVYVHTRNFSRPDARDKMKGLIVLYGRGYYTAPEFKGPDYDKKEIRNSPYPDRRSTIYWNGNIITDSSGKAALKFFTADNPIQYNVSVIGITAGGEIVSAIGKIVGMPQ